MFESMPKRLRSTMNQGNCRQVILKQVRSEPRGAEHFVSTKTQVFLIAILLAASFRAFAAVYKCETADGKTAYSDAPCDNAATVQKLEKFSRPPTRRVSASVSHRQMTRRYVDGYAYWAKPDRELRAVFYPRTLTEEERARVAAGKRLDIYAEESTGHVTLLFDSPGARRNTLRHMRSVFIGFSADNPKTPWTSHHRGDDLTAVLQRFDLGEDDDGNTWLQFRSRESTENTSWQIEFALPVQP